LDGEPCPDLGGIEDLEASIAIAATLAPPCSSPERAPIAPPIHEYICALVEAISLAANVEALKLCSACNTRQISKILASFNVGLVPLNI
jgi:hypothetical protein